MTFNWGMIVGGLVVAVIALFIAVILLATGGSDDSNSPPIVITSHPCMTTVRPGRGAELDLSDSGLDCIEAKAVQGRFQTAISRHPGSGIPIASATIDGWRCESLPLAGYPTLISCQSDGGRHLEAVATDPYPAGDSASEPSRPKSEPTQHSTIPGPLHDVFDGPVHPPITSATYHEDMRAWSPIALTDKVGLAWLFYVNNPSDCSGKEEFFGDMAGAEMVGWIQDRLEAGETGGREIAEVMMRFCLVPLAE